MRVLLALLIIPSLATYLFGPTFVSSSVFFVSTFLMLLIIIPNLYLEGREHQSFDAWKRALNIPPILLKLPYEARGDIVSISADKRSVHVLTTEGKSVVKKRFSEALNLLGEQKGVQVHRSHWVAINYIKGRTVEGASNFVELTTGDLVPLSAANIDKVDDYIRKAG